MSDYTPDFTTEEKISAKAEMWEDLAKPLLDALVPVDRVEVLILLADLAEQQVKSEEEAWRQRVNATLIARCRAREAA